MKILRIRFANLNSLVGEWDIDLTQPAFQSDGIFAITGPTGAGKSTILDAICLALYGRTPRLERVNKSGNDILSRHSADCFAEVTFETQNGRYRSHWSQHRARHRADGALQQPRHEISDADSGEILDERLTTVAARIVEVTGMDFERFTRSMLLAQGHFAAFLQSSPDARAPILEQITGTALYSRISVAVHERLSDEKQTLQALQAECAGLTLLDAEQEAALREQLAQRRAQEQAAETALRATRQALDWLEELATRESELEDIRTRRAAHEEELAQLVPERERLKRAERAAGLDGEYASLSALRSQRAESTATERELEQALPSLEARARSADEALEQATRASADAQARIATQKPRLQALRALDQQLGSQAAQVDAALSVKEEEGDALAAARAEVERARSADKKAAASLTQAQARRDAHAGQARETRRAAADSLAAAEAEQERASARLRDLLDGRELRDYHNDRNTLLRESFLLSRIAELEEQRARLTAGEPCPLCGSTEHPFASGEVPSEDDTRRRLTAVEEQIDRIEAQQEALTAIQARVTAVHREQSVLEASLARTGEAMVAEAAEAERRQQSAHAATATAEALLAARERASQKAEQHWREAGAALEALRDTRRRDYGDLDAEAEERRAEQVLEQAQRGEREARERRDEVLREHHRSADRLSDVRATLSRLVPQLDQRESAWSDDLRDAGFADESVFLAARLEPAEREALAQRLKAVDERGVALATQLRDGEARLAAARARELTDRDVPTLQAELRDRQALLTEHQSERAALAHRLSENEQAAERLREQQSRIDAQQRECRRWEALHALIGSADGKKYRNFAQGLTFDMMIVQANQQLQRMSDRYLLVRDAEQPLELNVIDNYQAGEVRSTRNLSGGESFLVSLALALGLSRMASRNVRVDSLFLDEGFGTLDEDALDTALETLSGLQQEGKLIGVISHVPALKERIATQIRVIPLSGGRSRIEVAT